MFALLLGLSMFGVAITDIGNDNPEWEYVGAQECISGYKKSGFSFTIGKKVFFKQKNIDGTLGSVCSCLLYTSPSPRDS